MLTGVDLLIAIEQHSEDRSELFGYDQPWSHSYVTNVNFNNNLKKLFDRMLFVC